MFADCMPAGGWPVWTTWLAWADRQLNLLADLVRETIEDPLWAWRLACRRRRELLYGPPSRVRNGEWRRILARAIVRLDWPAGARFDWPGGPELPTAIEPDRERDTACGARLGGAGGWARGHGVGATPLPGPRWAA